LGIAEKGRGKLSYSQKRTPGAKEQKPGILRGTDAMGEMICLKTECMRSRPRDRCGNISEQTVEACEHQGCWC